MGKTGTARSHKGIWIVERDLDMLSSLSTARFLTTTALDWLHFPSWIERWKKAQEGTLARYRPQTSLYDRLRRLERLGLVHRIVRSVCMGVGTFQRDTDVWCLAETGAHLLVEQRGLPADQVQSVRVRERSFLELEHAVTIGKTYAALRTKIGTMPGVSLNDWKGDSILSREYDRIDVPVPNAVGGMQIEQLPILPDATFLIVHPEGALRCFVEVDRGRSFKSWRAKIRAYHTYQGHLSLQRRYQTRAFVLLTLTTSEVQRRGLMRATAEIIGQPTDSYLFGLMEHIHPHTIGMNWKRIDAIEREPRRGENGMPYVAVTCTDAPHEFLV